MLTPDKAQKILIEVGDDDIIIIPHAIRDGADAARLEAPPHATVNVIANRMDGVTTSFLHETLKHSNPEAIRRTLEVTHGYKPQHIPKCTCEACAIGNARRRGLSHKIHTNTIAMMQATDDFQGVNSDTDDESLDDILAEICRHIDGGSYSDYHDEVITRVLYDAVSDRIASVEGVLPVADLSLIHI